MGRRGVNWAKSLPNYGRKNYLKFIMRESQTYCGMLMIMRLTLNGDIEYKVNDRYMKNMKNK